MKSHTFYAAMNGRPGNSQTASNAQKHTSTNAHYTYGILCTEIISDAVSQK